MKLSRFSFSEKQAGFGRKFGRDTPGPPLPLHPACDGIHPSRNNQQQRETNNLSPDFLFFLFCFLTEASLQSKKKLSCNHIIERIACLYKYTVRYPQHPLLNHSGWGSGGGQKVLFCWICWQICKKKKKKRKRTFLSPGPMPV